MKLLLDTHTFLWLLSEPSQLPSLVLEAIASSENMLLVSVVSLWEATIKSAKGSLILPGSDIGSVASAIQKRGITILAFEVEDLAELET